MPCIHQSDVFRKQNFKGVQLPEGVEVNCLLCYVLGLRSAFLQQQAPRIEPRKPHAELIDPESFSAGVEVFYTHNPGGRFFSLEDQDLQVLTLEDAPACTFPIRKSENGETYHGLLAALLAPDVKVDVSEASAAQVDFLHYYLSQEKISKSGHSGDRATCTDFIARAFNKNLNKQQKLHQVLRDFFSDKLLAEAVQTSYAKTSSLSKYYINRYLSESAAALEGPAKLPKAQDVGRIGLVFVRRAHTAGDGRMMTPDNLQAVLRSFVELNGALTDQRRDQEVLISHVILFGDIAQAEVQQLQREYARQLQFIHLPSPFFETTSETMKALRGIGPYAQFSDYTPLEAKLFSIFITLRERYGDKLFGVGFRSGTLDGAGFLGIPVFYFDDTTSKGERYKQHYASGEYLVDPSKDEGIQERVLSLTRSVNTFIRINNAPVKDRANFIQLDGNALAHLRAALSIWMCMLPDRTQRNRAPLWTGRVALMRDLGKRARLKEWLRAALG